MKFEVIEERMVDKHAGLIADYSIRLTNPNVMKDYPDRMRMVIYEDYDTNNVYRFITNDFSLEAITIAELYRERWQIELFFKWIKQHLHIKSFYGTSENAVYSQIWIAICDYLLLIIAHKIYHIEQDLYIFSHAIELVLFEKIPISDIFKQEEFNKTEPEWDGQLSLF
jgi:IS4 transposase